MTKKGFYKITSFILSCVVFSGCAGTHEAEISSVPEPTAAVQNLQSAQPKQWNVRISEIMSKNKSTLRAPDGSFPDWFELENTGSDSIDLSGWTASDNPDSGVQPLGGILEPGAYLYFCADGFKLSVNESLYIFDPDGHAVCSVCVSDDTSDFSLVPDGCGGYSRCAYPTPGYENTKEAFACIQENSTFSGPLVINEVAVDNFSFYYNERWDSYPDWVEIKNVSSESVNLSDYALSDDSRDPDAFVLPDVILQSGELFVILCDSNAENYIGNYPMAPFSLDSESERLYLSSPSSGLVDMVSLRDIPYSKTYGRSGNENGFFYLDTPTPGQENSGGFRYVSDMPVSKGISGIIEDSGATVELSAAGDIYYTTDTTVPTTDSEKYTGPFDVTETCVVRAIAIENGAVQSRVLTLNYIINEGHNLPVVSIVSDNKAVFTHGYRGGYKFDETPGSVSYYGPEGSFSLGCGLKLHGDTSLVLPKPGVSVRFRGSYGQAKLNFDLFGGGVTEFTSLLLRGGQDQKNTIVRNEALQNIAMEFSDSIVCQRNKYCVLYIDGEYRGVHALMEKTNEQLYASLYNVSKNSVIENEATVYMDEQFFKDVISPAIYGDMSDTAEYAAVCQVLDIDSIIDWTIIEGWSGNYDLASGNLRYYKSDENDGKWRLAFYDLDCAFSSPVYTFDNVLNYPNQIDTIVSGLLRNDDFKARFLQRASEGFSTVLTDDRMLNEIETLSALISSEMPRDAAISGMSYTEWQAHIDNLKQMIVDSDWTRYAINSMCNLSCLRLTYEEQEQLLSVFISE